MKLQNIIENREVTNWDYMDSLFNYIYSRLQVKSLPDTTFALLMQPMIPSKQKTLFAELLFETHGLGSLLLSSTSFAAHCETLPSIVLDSGDTMTSSIAYSYGWPVENSLQTLDIGGRSVTDTLCKMLRLSGYNFQTSVHKNDNRNRHSKTLLDFLRKTNVKWK